MDGPDPLVAIITRTKNRPLLLARAIQSIKNQTYTNYIHIIVNDGGDPLEVASIVAEVSSTRSVVLTINSYGKMEAATNHGVHYARESGADFITLLDDDDTWSSEFLQVMIREYFNYGDPFAAGIVCRSNIVHEKIDGNTIIPVGMQPANPRMPEVGVLPLHYLARLEDNFGVNQFLYRVSALDILEEATGDSQYAENLPVYGDWDFNLRFITVADILLIPNYLAFYHHRVEDNATNTSYHQVSRESCKIAIINKHLRDPKSIFAPFFRRLKEQEELENRLTKIEELLETRIFAEGQQE